MSFHSNKSFFTRYKNTLFVLSILYVLALLLSHAVFPTIYVWAIACFFSIAMNFTYLTEAASQKAFITTEASLALVLIIMSVVGLLTSPILIILAIFGHGCWDFAKHWGTGIPFFSWYTWGCVTIDWLYSFALLLYWIG